MKNKNKWSYFAALFSSFLVPTLAQADDIRLYNWESYLSESFKSDFGAKSGHTIKEIYFDTEDVRDSTILAGRASVFDVIMMDTNSLNSFSSAGLFADLSQLDIPNRQYIGQKWQKACGDYGLPYAYGTLGIAYRSSINKTPIQSWKQLLDPPEEHVGRTAMLFDTIDSTAVALMSQGYSPFTGDPDQLTVAFQQLSLQKPKLLTYQYAVSYAIEHGPASTISMAMVYSTDMWSLEEYTGQMDWEYVIPDEGTMLWVDCLSVPSDRLITDAVIAFLNDISDPQVAYKNAEAIWITTVNDGALAYASNDYLNDPSLFPPKVVMDKSLAYEEMAGEALSIRKRMLLVVEGLP